MSTAKTARRTWQLDREPAGPRSSAASARSSRGRAAATDDNSCSDATHPKLFIEGKLRTVHTTRTLFDATRTLAKKEKKIPILGLFDKNRPGFLLVVHCDDLPVVLAEYAAALPDEQRDRLEGLIRTACARQRDGETA